MANKVVNKTLEFVNPVEVFVISILNIDEQSCQALRRVIERME